MILVQFAYQKTTEIGFLICLGKQSGKIELPQAYISWHT